MNAKLAACQSKRQKIGTGNSNQDGHSELACEPWENLHPTDGCSAVAGVYLTYTEDLSDVTPHDNCSVHA